MITKTIKSIEEILNVQPINEEELKIQQKKIERLEAELFNLDARIKDLLVTDEQMTDEIYSNEVEIIEEYTSAIETIYVKMERAFPPYRPTTAMSERSFTTQSGASSTSQSETGSGGRRRLNVKLPKLSVRKFTGEPLDWLSWWTHFEKIHDLPDEELDPGDKFEYLIQAMTPKTRAADIVASYPATANNYPKVIKALQDRFAKPKMLRRLYIRELLKLVSHNTKKTNRGEIAQLYDQLESHLRALESLSVTPEQTSEFIFPMVESALPGEVLMAWQRSSYYQMDAGAVRAGDGLNTELDFLMAFLSNEAECEAQREVIRAGFDVERKSARSREDVKSPENRQIETPFTGIGLLMKTQRSCTLCSFPHHSVDECRRYEKLTEEERRRNLMRAGACFRCLKTGHRVRECSVPVECGTCGGKSHLKQMCTKSTKVDVQTDTMVLNTTGTAKNGVVLLKTVLVRVVGTRGSRVVRLMFDEGSQRSCVSSDLVKKIAPPCVSEDWQRNVLFGNVLTEPRNVKSYDIEIISMDGKYTQKMIFKETPEICGVVPRVQAGRWYQELERNGVTLTDVEKSGEASTVSILVGSDYWGSLIISAPVKVAENLYAVNSKFGWTLSGEEGGSEQQLVVQYCLNQSRICSTWDLETIGIRVPENDAVIDHVQKHFEKTLARNVDRTYCTELPWHEDPSALPTNREIAEKRLQSTTRKLIREGTFEAYDALFSEWERDQIIEAVAEPEVYRGHYLPHRAVYRPDSRTTPVRPVFDASCKVGRNLSLNSYLSKGPNLLDLLPAIVLRFRENAVAFTADIRRAFLTIGVAERDRDYLRFLWWRNYEKREICVFRHRRVVFGLTCSPYLLNAVIAHHLNVWPEETDNGTIEKLKASFYVDNLVGSVNSEEEYVRFRLRATAIMEDAGMELREWASNVEPGTDPVKLLGLIWKARDDTLLVKVPVFSFRTSETYTRRTLTSSLQRIFDPLGFLSPVLMLVKIWVQQSWQITKDWDAPLPETITIQVRKWFNEIETLRNLSFCRRLSDSDKIQLHVFCDASVNGYAAVIFARNTSSGTIRLVQSRARLAPLKVLTVPRLELLGCLIGARLLKSTMESLTGRIEEVYLWSDSSTALAWIKGGSDWSIFVKNRVSEIRELTTPESWRYVPGMLNYADVASRGIFPVDFESSKWWEGPRWLLNTEEWPMNTYEIEHELVNAEEKKNNTVSLATIQKEYDCWYLRSSNFASNVRILAYVLRFAKGKRPPTKSIAREEYSLAEKWILKKVQDEAFTEDKSFPVVRHMYDDLWCVKTKLVNSGFRTNFKWPILLPAEHPVVEQIVRMTHLRQQHCGPGILRLKLRERFWIVQARKMVKKVVRECAICRRFTAREVVVEEGELPTERISLSKVFQTVGIDLAGPLYCKDGKKSWIVLFTCAVYRAVHLEVVTSLSTADFLLAFRRFVCRRGRPSTIYTDNGTNFEGAAHCFRSIDWREVQKVYNAEPMTWKFNPPSAPWWGGFWERLVRVVKDLVRRMLGRRKLSLSEIENLLFEVEAVVNGRPLTYVSENEELEVLTPAHFLMELAESNMPELEVLSAGQLRKQFKLLVQLRAELKQRFRREYLALLVSAPLQRRRQLNQKLQIGEIVLIGSDDKRRQVWSMGRVVQLLPARDGSVRLVKLRTQNGECLRPVQRLYPLEVRQLPVPDVKSVVMPFARVISTGAEDEAEIRSRFGRRIRRPARFN